MDMVALQVTARDKKAKANQLRQKGMVPAVVYGHEVKSLHVQCPIKDLHKAFVKAGESTLVELDLDGKKIPVLFKDISFDPISSRELHADFYAVNMKEEIETAVPIHFEGESPAVKDQAAIFVVTHGEVTVRCLPANLPHSLTVNISSLANFHDVVAVKDIVLPKGVTIMDDSDTVVATVQEPRKEEVIVPAAPAEGEVAATAEGAAPAEASAEGASEKADEKGAKK